MPERVQLRRMKGWRKPEGVVVVARPSRWGNPFRVRSFADGTYRLVVADRRGVDRVGGDYPTQWDAAAAAVDYFASAIKGGSTGVPSLDEIRSELAGLDLACWCPADSPCHADVLLELANAPTPPSPTLGGRDR